MIPRVRVPLVNRSTVLVVLALLIGAVVWALGPVEPETIAERQKRPAAVVVAGGAVWWTTAEDLFAHSLVRERIVDHPAPVPSPAANPHAQVHGSYLAVRADGAAFWSASSPHPVTASGGVFGFLPGGPTRVWRDQLHYVGGLAAAGDHVFWIGDGKLEGASSMGAPFVLSTAQVVSVAADEDEVYWTETVPVIQLVAAAHDGSGRRTVALGVHGSHIDASAPEDLVIAVYTEILRVPKAGGAPVKVTATHNTYPWQHDAYTRLAVSGGEVFATTIGGRIVRAPLSGGEEETLVRGQHGPSGIAADASFVYWAETDAGRIRRIRRP